MQPTPPILFDRALLRKRRARVAAHFSTHDFLLREMAERVAESLSTMSYRFPTVVELGSHTGQLASLLAQRSGTTRYMQCDLSPAMLQQSTGTRVAVDEECLPFAENSVDAVVSIGTLHWVNDLPGTLAQIQRILKPDGLFMAILPGAESLHELRTVCAQTDAARSGGISPRVSPFIDIRDAGALLHRAGFALPVVDTETLRVSYSDVFAVMRDLRCAAQQNMLRQRLQHFTPRGWFMAMAERYAQQFSDEENRITASVELITMTAWKPSPNQQQPARRGSGTVSFLEGLG